MPFTQVAASSRVFASVSELLRCRASSGEVLTVQTEQREDAQKKADTKDLLILSRDIEGLDLASIAQALRGVEVKPIGPLGLQDCRDDNFKHYIEISFEDGVDWLARFPQRRFGSPPPRIQRLMTEGGIRTTMVLKGAGVAVPDCHVPKNHASLANLFFFVNYPKGMSCSLPLADMTTDQLDSFITSYAKVSASITNVSFTGIGSICSADPLTNTQLGPLLNLDFCKFESPYFLGPFRTNKDRYLAQIDFYLHDIVRPIWPSTCVAPAGYYTHLWLRDLVEGMEELGRVEPTYVKISAEEDDHIGVNTDSQEVMCIGNWEGSYTVPKAEAFAAPLRFLDIDFFSGNINLTKYEVQLATAYDRLGRSDLGDCVRGGKLYQHLEGVLGRTPQMGHIHALQEIVTGKRGEEDEEEWYELLKVKYGEIKTGDGVRKRKRSGV